MSLVVPIGGGGLISGMAIAAKALKPEIESSAWRPRSILRCTTLIKRATLPMRGDTIAEGIAVKEPGRSPPKSCAR